MTDDDVFEEGYGKVGKTWGANDVGPQGYGDPYMFTITATCDATYCLAISIIIVIAVYFAIGGGSFLGPDGKLSQAMVHVWWVWVRIPVGVAILFCFTGIVKSFVALVNLMTLMLPDRSMEKTGEVPSLADRLSPYGYASAWATSCIFFAQL